MAESLQALLGAGMSWDDSPSVVLLVDRLLEAARQAGASDLHLQPTADGLLAQWRLDGVLQPLGTLPKASAAQIIARLKVLADLLTYRTDVPQEGRIRARGEAEMRLSTFPTLHGEKAAVRFFQGAGSLHRLHELGLPEFAADVLPRLLAETSGAILTAGPAGSGKTTTMYACLREIVAQSGGGRSIVTLEDPIEVEVPGTTQSQIQPQAGLDIETGLRSLVRQDPEVLLVSEIRDRATAEAALQAALTGHLVLSSLHAATAVGALGRLLDMGIEPYVLRSGVLAVLAQRLVRTLCDCAVHTERTDDFLGFPVARARVPVGCDTCRHSGYTGRMLLAELLLIDSSRLAEAILAKADVQTLEQVAIADGLVSRWEHANRAIESGRTSPAEVRRVLGFGQMSGVAQRSTIGESDGGRTNDVP